MGSYMFRENPVKPKMVLLSAVLLFVGLLVGACAGAPPASDSARLPWFAKQSPQVERGYRIALASPDLLEKIPCYCGCGTFFQPGHRFLKDCFLKPEGGFDPHASGCEVCLLIAIKADSMARSGIPLKDIRAQIDVEFRQYGQPTNTPPLE
jgi:hypothetical protein